MVVIRPCKRRKLIGLRPEEGGKDGICNPALQGQVRSTNQKKDRHQTTLVYSVSLNDEIWQENSADRIFVSRCFD